jgi:hypothetical protein
MVMASAATISHMQPNSGERYKHMNVKEIQLTETEREKPEKFDFCEHSCWF